MLLGNILVPIALVCMYFSEHTYPTWLYVLIILSVITVKYERKK